ncbi:MAG: TVP38/TMEM64 family protein [Leptolyngbya sp. IPPAS B-1204]|uniref:TVP38/TMEM64 family membrane protein n=1 Tax=Leptolyngbya sp. NK1-12 TaxID=2547451 RepID=A0AA96WV42_9CYAN|nr:TVP38/TMEM64 family protein [Elainella sp. C42_A2020_010]RNJ70074.1 MAG: TVP38/TMEM64 family protein [Leptolyngbya sp. IPPAS B-1204]WNZ24057.1 TVP38/TMEM64 family protein [Leptolyngbya sp. NK1-12]
MKQLPPKFKQSQPVSKRRSRLRALFTAQNGIALSLLLFCLSTAWWLLTQSGIDFSQPAALIDSIQSMGWLGILLYIGFLFVAIVIGPIPSTPVTVAAGAIWDPNLAGFFGVIGIYLGSLAAYFIGRTLGRSVVRALLGKVIYFSSHRGEVYLGWLVFVSHLLPFMPYDLVSYGAGISGMSFPIYAATCLLGIIPCIFFLTHMGAALTGGLVLGICIAVLFVLVLVLLPWGVKRYNWLGLRDVIRVE